MYESDIRTPAIAKKYNCSLYSIISRLKQMGLVVDNRKYHPDEHFFDNPNDSETAYWLAFITADGCIHKDKRCDSWKLVVELKSTDANLLRKLSIKILGVDCVRLSSHYNKKTKVTTYSAVLVITNKNICKRLIALGITPRKSLTTTFPSWLDKPAYPSYVRGFYDGDGGISSLLDQVKFAGTNSFLLDLQKLLYNELSINLNLKEDGSISKLSTGVQNEMKVLLDWMYKDSTIHLDRKYQLYLQFLNRFNKLKEKNEKYNIDINELLDKRNKFSIKELANQYNVSSDTIKNRLNKAKNQISL